MCSCEMSKLKKDSHFNLDDFVLYTVSFFFFLEPECFVISLQFQKLRNDSWFCWS